jgi:glycosyltransferase involved in cell wall biosynthesis
VRLAAPEAHWLDGADLVVFPAFVESQPRRLLAALASGVPVIATPACGLGPREPAGDAAALCHAVEAALGARAVAA